MFLGIGPVVFRLSSEGRGVFGAVSKDDGLLVGIVEMQDDHGAWVSLQDSTAPYQLVLVKWAHFDTAVIDQLPPPEPRRVRIGFKN